MILIEDTRQQAGKHRNIAEYCSRHGITIVRRKLDVGDYMLEDGRVSVDTKFGLQEVYGNVVREHDRFRRELIRAKDMGITLVILVEERGIQSVDDVAEWVNPRIAAFWRDGRGERPPVPSAQLMRMMKTMGERYGARWEFCAKNSTGKRLMEILTDEC